MEDKRLPLNKRKRAYKRVRLASPLPVMRVNSPRDFRLSLREQGEV